jgi:hypothetical protein
MFEHIKTAVSWTSAMAMPITWGKHFFQCAQTGVASHDIIDDYGLTWIGMARSLRGQTVT